MPATRPVRLLLVLATALATLIMHTEVFGACHVRAATTTATATALASMPSPAAGMHAGAPAHRPSAPDQSSSATQQSCQATVPSPSASPAAAGRPGSSVAPILAVPGLVYAAGESLPQAVTTSLLVVGITALVALLPRLRGRQIAWRIAAIFGAAGAATAYAGAAVNRLLPPQLTLALFAALMVAAATRMLRDSTVTGAACTTDLGAVNWRRCLPRSIAGGLTVGFLTGLLGVGGGFLIIPALVIVLGLPMTTAIGSSLVIITANSAAGFAAHAGDAPLDLRTTVTFTGAAVVAAVAAGALAHRVDTLRLRRWFAYVVLAVAVVVEVVAPVALGAAAAQRAGQSSRGCVGIARVTQSCIPPR